MANTSTNLPWPMLRRAWIERTAKAQRHIARPEICAVLGISEQQASADMQQLLKDHPGCLTYSLNRKRYEWTGGETLVTTIPEWISALRDP